MWKQIFQINTQKTEFTRKEEKCSQHKIKEEHDGAFTTTEKDETTCNSVNDDLSEKGTNPTEEVDPKELKGEDSPTAKHEPPPRDARTRHHGGLPEDDEDDSSGEESVEHEEEPFHFPPSRLSQL